MTQFRHGDLLIEKIDQTPEGTLTDNTLLAQGEGRNHGHFIESESTEIFKTDSEQNITHILNVKDRAAIKHLKIDSKTWTGEHTDILLDPGVYRVIRQREYDPYLKTIRIVKD